MVMKGSNQVNIAGRAATIDRERCNNRRSAAARVAAAVALWPTSAIADDSLNATRHYQAELTWTRCFVAYSRTRRNIQACTVIGMVLRGEEHGGKANDAPNKLLLIPALHQPVAVGMTVSHAETFISYCGIWPRASLDPFPTGEESISYPEIVLLSY
jgi:hypothetical protein